MRRVRRRWISQRCSFMLRLAARFIHQLVVMTNPGVRLPPIRTKKGFNRSLYRTSPTREHVQTEWLTIADVRAEYCLAVERVRPLERDRMGHCHRGGRCGMNRHARRLEGGPCYVERPGAACALLRRSRRRAGQRHHLQVFGARVRAFSCVHSRTPSSHFIAPCYTHRH